MSENYLHEPHFIPELSSLEALLEDKQSAAYFVYINKELKEPNEYHVVNHLQIQIIQILTKDVRRQAQWRAGSGEFR